MDCVVSYHLNPATCGVARFNTLLAQQFGVPLLGIFDEAVLAYREPLLSVKIEEFQPRQLPELKDRLTQLLARRSVRVFFHTFTGTEIERELIARAAAVYCGNAEIHRDLSALRADVVELWCPGMIQSHDRFQPAELKVFSFGMAHKVRSDAYVRLHQLLEGTGRTYALYISTALHESTSFNESFDGAFDELRELFGERVHFLGFLSDAAVYNYLLDSTYFAAFFERGVRANNTSVNAAMASGAVVITNLDQYSPPALRHLDNVLDIAQLTTLPTDPELLGRIRERARQTAQDVLGWRPFVAALRELEAATSARTSSSS